MSASARRFLGLALLSATGTMAATSGFLLGVDYSEWLTPNATHIATDSSGALYILSSFPISNDTPSSSVTKLSADGKTLLWQNQLGFAASTMAVDPNGGVYVTPVSLPADASIFVAKLNANGTGIAWKAPVGFILQLGFLPVLAADSSGRVYVAGFNSAYVNGAPINKADVVRLNAAGSAVDYAAQVNGIPTSLAVDGSGALFVAGDYEGIFLARLAPDGSAGFYSTVPQESFPAVSLDASGDAVVYASGVLQRFDATGAVTFSKTLATGALSYPGLALDAAGNAYVTESTSGDLYPVRNSLATCGSDSDLLSVFAPDGSLLQSTYIPGGQYTGIFPLVATSPDSSVFVVESVAETFAPTQSGPFSTSEADFLWHLVPNANAQTFPLACLGNAAAFAAGGPIAPGEMVSLFGNGLGPEQGVQTQATPRNPLPNQVANVEVTFDGTPAPLMWVQDAQINAVVPWSLTPGQTATQVCVSFNSVKTNCLTSPVAQTAPGVFTVDGFRAVALNQDGTLNSANNPAALGSIVSVFATGLGPIAPPQADGALPGLPLPSNVLPVEVMSAGNTGGGAPPFLGFVASIFPGAVTFKVTYAGPAPYLIAGESRIDFKVVSYQGPISVILPSTQSNYFGLYVAGQ